MEEFVTQVLRVYIMERGLAYWGGVTKDTIGMRLDADPFADLSK
jgi:hypothetical protein